MLQCRCHPACCCASRCLSGLLYCCCCCCIPYCCASHGSCFQFSLTCGSVAGTLLPARMPQTAQPAPSAGQLRSPAGPSAPHQQPQPQPACCGLGFVMFELMVQQAAAAVVSSSGVCMLQATTAIVRCSALCNMLDKEPIDGVCECCCLP